MSPLFHHRELVGAVRRLPARDDFAEFLRALQHGGDVLVFVGRREAGQGAVAAIVDVVVAGTSRRCVVSAHGLGWCDGCENTVERIIKTRVLMSASRFTTAQELSQHRAGSKDVLIGAATPRVVAKALEAIVASVQ